MDRHLTKSKVWSDAPDLKVRKQKRDVEEELLQKLCVKKELLSRLGPRDSLLPNLVKPYARIRIQEVPTTDTEYHALRAAANGRLTKLFSEWTGFNRLAFPMSNRKKTQYRNLDHKRDLSRSSLHKMAQAQQRRQSGSSMISSGADTKRGWRQMQNSGQKINRWRNAMKEIRQHLLASRMQLPRILPKSELRIYVSSTPDLQEEREFLEEVTYPKLLELCEEQGLSCYMVDMRSGSGVLTNDLETFHLIEKELQICRKDSIGPYFISLVGHALDDQGLPGFLSQAVYELIRKTLIKENIIGVEAFDDIYRLDSNQVPPVYVKQPIRTLEEYKSVEEVESMLYTALTQAVSVISQNQDTSQASDVDFYKWSVVVKEIECGLLSPHNSCRNTLCFMMDLEQDVVEEEEDTPIERMRLQVCQHYEKHACKNRLISFNSGTKSMSYLRAISDAVESRVATLMRSQIRSQEYDITQHLTEGTEALQHVRLATSERENIVGNEDIISAIKDILEETASAPKTILLWGQSGSGKTAIVSKICRSSTQWQHRRKVVFRCLGTTLRSSSLFRVLESLVKQLTFLFSLNTKLPTDMNIQQAVSLFCNTLEVVSAQRELYGDLLLVLDQLERLPGLDAHHLLCILNSVTTGITLILTLETPHPLFSILRSHTTVHTISTTYMNKNDFCVCIKNNLKNINRLVTNDQLQSTLNALPMDVTPLHAQMLFCLTRWWQSHTLPELKPLSDKPDVDFVIFLELTEKQLGRAFTRYALSFLASAKNGLAGHEIFHLLSKDSDLLNEIKEENSEMISVVDGFPYQYQISRLVSRLSPFLARVKLEGETVYQIQTRPLLIAISSKYLSDSFLYTVHFRLANFFMFIRRGLLLSSKEMSEQSHKKLSKYHWRMLQCIPYNLCHSSADTACVWTRLKEKVFYNFAWLINEVYFGCFNELLDDISYCLDNVSLEPDIQYLQQMLISVRDTVTHNPLSLAAVFASLKVKDSHSVSDSIVTLVKEARVWLKQIQVQALIPMSYTSNKTGRLLVKEDSVFGVTDIIFINDTDKLLVQRMRNISILQMLTNEEILLATLGEDIVSVDLLDDVHVVILTKDVSCKFAAEIFSLETDNHVRTVPLINSPILWFDVRSLKMSYFAVASSIKRADLERGSVMNVLTTKNEWTSSCISAGKPDTVFTVTVGNKTRIEATPIHDVSETKSVTLNNEPPNRYCKHLFSTKNGRHIIFVTETQAVVIDCSVFKAIRTYTYNRIPIINAELSRSHEHVFLAYADGTITCHVLHLGSQSMVAKINLKPHLSPNTTNEIARSATTTPLQDNLDTEIFTTLVTSEDDHFLFCGTNAGHVYIVHVPTGCPLVDITTQQQSISKIVYVTSKNHFQHIITLDMEGMALHWNLRPLLKQTRVLLQDYITDDDLYKEEETKLDLSRYFTLYESKRHNRMFLNGPDIKSFYRPPPTEVFSQLVNFDPAFGAQNDWDRTGSITDLTDHLKALACGNELSGILLTVSTDFRLAKWNLQNGQLMWSKKLQCFRKTIFSLASVYYDQAILLTQTSTLNGGFDISVMYTREGQSKTLTRDNVSNYWLSLDRTRVVLMCQDSEHPPGNMLYLWDLISARELVCEYQHSPNLDTKERILEFTSFSPSLQGSVCLVVPADDTVKLQPELSNSDTLFNSPDCNGHSAINDYTQHVKTSCSNSDMLNNILQSPTELRLITPNAEMMTEQGTTTPVANELENSPDTVMSVQEATLPKQENEDTCDYSSNIGNTDKAETPPGISCSRNDITCVFWTQIHVRPESSGSRDENIQRRGTTNVETGQKFPDINHPRPGSPASSESSKCTTNNTQDKTYAGYRNIATNAVNKDKNSTPSMVSHSEVCIPVRATSVCFVGEQEILVGTHSGHLLMLTVPSFHQVHALGEHGPTYGDEITAQFLQDAPAPHTDAVTDARTSQDLSVLLSSDRTVVCLWSAGDRTLTMKIELYSDQKITHMVMSKDAAMIAMVINSRTISLWTPVEHREVTSYRTTFDITDLQMTCDCHKVVVRGIGPDNNQILEVFDILNVDDILVHVVGRRQLQDLERREHLASERKTNRQQTESGRKSSQVNFAKDNSHR